MPDISPENRIYLTYKARIVSEAKLRRYSKIANALIIWYSFLLIIASLLATSSRFEIVYFETLSAAFSIATFASSIFLAAGVLDARANEFRACYLELQGIYNSDATLSDKMNHYQKALERYPNHNARDSNDLIFDTWIRGGKLYDTKSQIKFGFLLLLSSAFRRVLFWTVVACLFGAPIWFAPTLIRLAPGGN